MSCYPMLQALMTPDLTANESRIYAYLVGRANGSRVCWKRIEEIQADLRIKTRHTVCDATEKLAKMGLIRKQRRLRAMNHYFILDPDGKLYGAAPSWTPPWAESEPETPTVQKTAHQEEAAPIVQKTAHPEPPPECAKNHTFDVQKTAHSTPKDVQKTAQESLYQEVCTKEESKEEGSLRSPPARVRAGARTRGTRLPANWTLPEADRAYAVAHGVDPDLAAEEFRNFWCARPGSNAVKLDWSATFHNRVLDHQQRGKFPIGGARVIPIARGVRIDPRDAEYRRRLEDIERIGRRSDDDGPIIDGRVMA